MDDKDSSVSTPEICGFSLEKSLRNGYSGRVFRGHHLKSNQSVVVKLIKKNTSWTVETNALSNLDHPNIIKMVGKRESNVQLPNRLRKKTFKKVTIQQICGISYDLYIGKLCPIREYGDCKIIAVHADTVDVELANVHVLAQEFAANGDFYTLLLHHNSFPEDIARTLVKPILQALNYAYETGISHRDIKLENILIMEDGVIKLGDWGLSGFQTRGRLCSTSCGTLGYMAPEMVCREQYDANKTDVWAVAVLLFSLCTGVRPYTEPQHRCKGKDDYSWRDKWLQAMLEGNWKVWWLVHARENPIVNKLSTELKDLFEDMFAKTEKRATLKDVMNHEWMRGPLVQNSKIVSLCQDYV